MAVLPYLEGAEQVASEFHYGEPWDSPHNRLLLKYRPVAYSSTYDPSTPTAAYLLIAGEGTLFAEGRSRRLADIVDGPSNTICLAEVSQSGIIWSQPGDLDLLELIQSEPSNDGENRSLNSWDRLVSYAMFDGRHFVPDRTTTVQQMVEYCLPDDSLQQEPTP